MRKMISRFLGLAIIFVLLLALGGTQGARADVRVNINLGPPPIVVAEPPEVVLIPGSQVYFVPEPEIDIFFYNGYYWSPRGPRWYRARVYNGPWVVVEPRYVPAPVFRVPRDYRVIYGRERPIPYGQWKKQWKHREKEERKEWKQREKEERREWKEERKEHGEGHGRGRGRD